MIKSKNWFLASMIFLSVFVLVPKRVNAIDIKGLINTGNDFANRIRETLEYTFTFGTDKKIEVLEKQAERRLEKAKMYADDGNGNKVEDMVSNYGEIKERQNGLLNKVDNGQVVEQAAEKVVEQQQTMEEIKNRVIDTGTKEQMIQVQEQVVNQMAKNVIDVNGPLGQTEFFQKVEHVWAPGTGPGGEAGVIYEGGGKLIFAPGTSAGGPAGSDIKNVIIETDGGQGQVQMVID